MTKAGAIAFTVVVLTAGQYAAADKLKLSDDATIVISADESWEEQEEDIRHFRGNFEIKTPNWSISADQAILYGLLDNPDRVVADGTPVRFVYLVPQSTDQAPTRAEGDHLEYEKASGIIKLTGNVKILDNYRLIRSSEIRYDLARQKILAGGPEGVHITVEPGNSGKF